MEKINAESMRKLSLQQMVSCLMGGWGVGGSAWTGKRKNKVANDIQMETIQFRMECQDCNCVTLNPALLYSIRTEF
jgi:hypothetical protein